MLFDYCGLRNEFESEDFFSRGLLAGLMSLMLFVGAIVGSLVWPGLEETAPRNGETYALSEIDFCFSILGG